MTGKGRSNGKVPVLHGQNPTYLPRSFATTATAGATTTS